MAENITINQRPKDDFPREVEHVLLLLHGVVRPHLGFGEVLNDAYSSRAFFTNS